MLIPTRYCRDCVHVIKPMPVSEHGFRCKNAAVSPTSLITGEQTTKACYLERNTPGGPCGKEGNLYSEYRA